MPIYKYQCSGCGKEEEKLIPMSDIGIERRCLCGAIMARLMTLPQPAIYKLSTKEKVTGGLNANKKMNPEYAKLAMGGF